MRKIFLLVTVSVHIFLLQEENMLAQTPHALIETAQQSLNEGHKAKAAELFNKAAYQMWNNQLLDEAIDAFQQSIELNQELGNDNALGLLYHYLGVIYSQKLDYDNALEFYGKSLIISKQKQSKSTAAILANMAEVLANMGRVVEGNQKLMEALSIANDLNDKELQRAYFLSIAKNYEMLGDKEAFIRYYKMYQRFDNDLKDSQIQEKQKELASLKVDKHKIEMNKDQLEIAKDSLERIMEKRELQIALLEKEKVLQALTIRQHEAELKYERAVRYFVTALLAMALICLSIIFYQFRQKKRINVKLQRQHKLVSQTKEELEIRTSELQKQHKKVKDSIRYASKIQASLFPATDKLSNLFSHFMLYRPRDIVSGDFFWYTRVPSNGVYPDRLFLAVVDCTGHGVPGAFMSMIGNSLLNKIVLEKRVYKPELILEKLDRAVMDVLRQRETSNDDGMDMSLLVLEKISATRTKLVYAGAKHSLFIYDHALGSIRVVEGNIRAIGGLHHRVKEKVAFTAKEMVLDVNDFVYMSTDGMVDQNRPDRKKFGYKRFIDILESQAHKDIAEQGVYLEQQFDQFKSDEPQRDDILCMGISLDIKLDLFEDETIFNWANKVLLLVDDDALIAHAVKRILSKTQIEILLANNGEDAVETMKRNKDIDIILMDIDMPKLDGYEATRLAKQLIPHVPVVIQTVYSFSNEKELAYQAGCDDYINKPINAKELIATLYKFLGPY